MREGCGNVAEVVSTQYFNNKLTFLRSKKNMINLQWACGLKLLCFNYALLEKFSYHRGYAVTRRGKYLLNFSMKLMQRRSFILSWGREGRDREIN